MLIYGQIVFHLPKHTQFQIFCWSKPTVKTLKTKWQNTKKKTFSNYLKYTKNKHVLDNIDKSKYKIEKEGKIEQFNRQRSNKLVNEAEVSRQCGGIYALCY